MLQFQIILVKITKLVKLLKCHFTLHIVVFEPINYLGLNGSFCELTAITF
jgi:hypothetical protein